MRRRLGAHLLALIWNNVEPEFLPGLADTIIEAEDAAAELSSKSQPRTALDSAYKFTASRALRREAQRRCAGRDVRAAAPRTH
jgi:hypothetical protein